MRFNRIFVHMKKRQLRTQIRKYSRQYPLVALVGPRQSGKTTLARELFPKYRYLSLENIDVRAHAQGDPRGFFEDYGNKLILDEVQRVPDLFSYLQEIVDQNPEPAQYILTGSHQFLLFEGISQSLAGRIVTFKLFPFTLNELKEAAEDKDVASIFRKPRRTPKKISHNELYRLIFTGLYPRIYDKKLDSRKWVENYILTYVERDLRSLINIKNIRTFEMFLKLCSSLSGQLLNFANLANHLGIALSTVKQWVSILEASGLVFLLPPYHQNFSKRIIKTPKLYFVDTGILCYLLGIRTPDELKGHPLIGSIYETFIISECYKRISHLGEIPRLYFWRDKSGREIDLIIDEGLMGFPIEIKLAKTYSSEFSNSLEYWLSLKGNQASKGEVIYTGDQILNAKSNIPAIPWYYFI